MLTTFAGMGSNARALARAARPHLRVFAVAPIALVLCLSAAHADWIISGSCVRGGCVFTKRNRIVDPYVITVPGPRNDLEASEAAERERQWTTRCNPTLFQDRYGVSRYAYSAQGCEFGKSQ